MKIIVRNTIYEYSSPSQLSIVATPLQNACKIYIWRSAHVWMRWCHRVAPHAPGESTFMWLYTDVITYQDMYQAALMRRWTEALDTYIFKK